MSYPVYYVEAGDTLPILFESFDGGTGASITMTGLAVTDIEIYKDGGTTQRASDAGYTLLDTDGIDFDSITGVHGFSIDLSDDTDTGFYAVGSWYHVVVSSITIDSQTVSFIAAAFRIVSATRGMAGTALPDAAADAAGGLPISDAGGLDLDQTDANISAILTDTGTTLDNLVDDLESRLGTPSDLGSGATIAANLVDIEAQTDDIGAAGAELTAVPWNAAWDAEVQSEVNDALVAFFTSAAQLVDDIWDEVMSGHTTFGSYGQAFLALGGTPGRVNDGSAAATDFDTDGFTEATDNHFNCHVLIFTSGALQGQGRVIRAYTASGQNCAFDRPFTEAPADNDEFIISGLFSPVVDVWLARAADVESNSTVLDSRAAWWAAAKLVNRVGISGGTLTVYEDDDTTALFTQGVTSDAGADPVVDLNTT